MTNIEQYAVMKKLVKWFTDQGFTVGQAKDFLDLVKDEIEHAATVKEVHVPENCLENYLPLSDSSDLTD